MHNETQAIHVPTERTLTIVDSWLEYSIRDGEVSETFFHSDVLGRTYPANEVQITRFKKEA